MKKLINRLGAMLLCGAVLLTGCTKELKQKVADLEVDTAALQSEVNELKASLESTYVTKAELQALAASLSEVDEAVASLQTLVASKADKSALDAAVADLEAKIAALDSKFGGYATLEGLNALSVQLETLAAKVEAIRSCSCDAEALAASITALTDDLSKLNNTVTEYMTETDAALEALQAEIDKINSEEFLAEIYSYVDTEDQELRDAIAAIADDLVEMNKALAEAVKKAEDALAAAGSSDSSASVDALRKEFEALKSALQSQISAINSKLANYTTTSQVQNLINSALSQYAGINDKIDALTDRVAALESAIVSVVMIPETIVNGANAVKFDTFVYTPVGGTEEKAVSGVSYVSYRINPSTASVSAEDFVVVSHEAEIITKADEAAVVIEGVEYADGVAKVALRRASGEGNMFAVGVKSGESYVYSEYAQIYDETVTELEFAGAQVDLKSNETFDLSTVKVTNIDAEAYGFSYRYECDSELPVESGVVTGDAAYNGSHIVRVVLVDADDEVVDWAIVNVNVLAGAYNMATAKVSATAERVAVELTDIETWARNLYAEPNTIELIKQAGSAVLAKDFETAYEKLGGVPGFVKKSQEFTGAGTGLVKPADDPHAAALTKSGAADLSAALDELIAQIPEETLEQIKNTIEENNVDVDAIISDLEGIQSATDLTEVIEKVNEQYPGLIEDVTGALEDAGVKVEDILPEGIEGAVTDIIYQEIPESLKQLVSEDQVKSLVKDVLAAANIEISDLTSLIQKLPEFDSMVAKLQEVIKEKIPFGEDLASKLEGLTIDDIINAETVAKIKDAISAVVEKAKDYIDNAQGGETEGGENEGGEAEGGDAEAQNYCEAQKKAIAEAVADLEANIAAANKQILDEQIPNGNWGKLSAAVDKVIEILPETVGEETLDSYLSELKAALETIVKYAEDLATYRYDSYEVVEVSDCAVTEL